MKRRFVLLVTLIFLVWATLGIGTAGAGLSGTLDYHVADQFIADGTGIPQVGAVSEADNGDTISVVGNGNFNRGSKKASGGGTFVHQTKTGKVVASGSWRAISLQSFTFYGCGDGTTLPENFCGGLAVLNIEALPHGGGPIAAVMEINCKIPESAPGEEGITLEVPGTIAFDEIIGPEDDYFGGLTVFVSKGKR